MSRVAGSPHAFDGGSHVGRCANLRTVWFEQVAKQVEGATIDTWLKPRSAKDTLVCTVFSGASHDQKFSVTTISIK